MFDGLIPKYKEKKNLPPPPHIDKKSIFFSSLGQNRKINMYISSVYLVKCMKYNMKYILVIIRKKKKMKTGL